MKSQAVVLAGGFGTRLVDLIGSDIPKPMAKIFGRPLLEWTLDCLKRNKIKNVLFLLHHNHEYIQNHFNNGKKFGININYSIEKTPRGTAGAIYDNIEKLEKEFFIIYGDTFLDINLLDMKSSKKKDDSLVALVHPSSHPLDSDLIKMNSNNKIIEIFKQNKSKNKYYKNLTNAALYYCEGNIFKNQKILTKGVVDISSNLIPKLIKSGKTIKGYLSSEYIKDMGTPERYIKVEENVANNVPSLLSLRNKRKCVFLDRDGVVNYEKGHLNNIDDFEIRPEIISLIKLFNTNGWLTIIITNQPVIARGELSFKGLEDIHNKMDTILGNKGAYIDGLYFCPHHPDSGFDGEVKELKINCECRKPKPGLINKAIEDFNINPLESWLIGDNERDIEAALNAKVNPILLDESKKENYLNTEDNVTVSNSITTIYNFLREKI
ncbi:MAG: HAD-IIIA family hydrolase [Thermodesulfobacteriota bacterium]|jgi:mannose-1-phosphate guanylyltransferase/phosphomannomutase|tara:strand:+ start:2556 stop:3863 length:1308 start_codon:yes stop_codon:yes gene_type:complete